MYSTCLSSKKVLIASSNKKILIVKVEALGLSANSALILAIVVDKEVAKIETSFLPVLNTSSSNSSFFCSYNT